MNVRAASAVGSYILKWQGTAIKGFDKQMH